MGAWCTVNQRREWQCCAGWTAVHATDTAVERPEPGWGCQEAYRSSSTGTWPGSECLQGGAVRCGRLLPALARMPDAIHAPAHHASRASAAWPRRGGRGRGTGGRRAHRQQRAARPSNRWSGLAAASGSAAGPAQRPRGGARAPLPPVTWRPAAARPCVPGDARGVAVPPMGASRGCLPPRAANSQPGAAPRSWPRRARQAPPPKPAHTDRIIA